MITQLRLIMQALPWTGPAIIGGAVLGILSMFVFPRRRSGFDKLGLAIFLWCVTLALVVTLSPVKNYYFGIPDTGCNLSVWQPLNYHYWLSSGSRPPNVWLLMPAGVGIMIMDGVWRRLFGVIFLIGLPPMVEAAQDYFPQLKRSCSSQDIVDNWTGLAIGLAIGAVLAVLIGIFRGIRRWMRRRSGRDDGPARYVSDGDGALPLGGGRPFDDARYDEFGDFDDTPRSSRWYEDGSEGAAGSAGERRPRSPRDERVIRDAQGASWEPMAADSGHAHGGATPARGEAHGSEYHSSATDSWSPEELRDVTEPIVYPGGRTEGASSQTPPQGVRSRPRTYVRPPSKGSLAAGADRTRAMPQRPRGE